MSIMRYFSRHVCRIFAGWVVLMVCACTGYAQHPGFLDTTFFNGGATGVVYVVKTQPDGKILVGGEFWKYGGYVKLNMVRLYSNGEVDPSFVCNIDGIVYDILLQPDGKIIISGAISKVGSTYVDRIARINTDGSYDASFDIGDGPSGAVYTTALRADGKVLVGGAFSTFDNQPSHHLVLLNTDGSRDLQFAQGGGPDSYVHEIAIETNGIFYICGEFDHYDGVARPGLAKINADGTLYTGFQPGSINNWIKAIVPYQGGVVIGGVFTNIAGFGYNRIARLDASGQLDHSFAVGTGFDYYGVYDMALQPDGKIIAGGYFDSFNGVAKPNLARLNTDGSLDTNFSYLLGGPDNAVEDIELLPGSKVLLGGSFTNFGFTKVAGCTRLMGDKAVPSDFDGDGLTDVSVYYPLNGSWYVRSSVDGTLLNNQAVQWGWSAAIPIALDIDSDSKADHTIFDTATGMWYIKSSIGGAVTFTNTSWINNIPIVADFTGDRYMELAGYNPGTGNWLIYNPSTEGYQVHNWGWGESIPVAEDYDGDGRADISVYDRLTGDWYLNNSSEGFQKINWGWSGAYPYPADYDGDGKCDLCVYDAHAGVMYIRYYSGQMAVLNYGSIYEIPVPGIYQARPGVDVCTYAPTSGFWGVWQAGLYYTWGWGDAAPLNQQFWINASMMR